MTGFEIAGASAADMEMIRGWADEEGWNPGDSDRFAFAVADPEGFLVGRLDGEPAACISAVRYGAGFGFIGFYIARPDFRGRGYGIRLWRAGMERLDGRLVGLDGVVEQQDNYRKSGFRSAWNNIRVEGVPQGVDGADGGGGVEIVDAATLPFGLLAAYDRRFFPAPRDAFLSAWTGLPGRTALAAVRGGRIEGLGVIRPCSAAHRIGPCTRPPPRWRRRCCGGSRGTRPAGWSPWTSRTPTRTRPRSSRASVWCRPSRPPGCTPARSRTSPCPNCSA